MKQFGMHTTENREKRKLFRGLLSVTLLIVFIFSLSGCKANIKENADIKVKEETIIESGNDNAEIENAESERTYTGTTDGTGNTGKNDDENSKRVIALSKSNAELWILAGGKLLATSDDAMEIEGLNTDAVSLGDMDHVSLEAIAALNPDLLILFSTDPAQKALGEAAEGIGINVYYTNIDGFSDYEKVMTEFTSETGRKDLYKKNVKDVRNEIDEVIGKASGENISGTYLCLHVSATKQKVEKNDYFACEIFNDLGLVNIANDTSVFDELSLEAIVTENPDYIFVIPRGSEEKALASFSEVFSSQPVWESLSAVKNGNYYLLSKDLFGLKPNAQWGLAYREAYKLLPGNR